MSNKISRNYKRMDKTTYICKDQDMKGEQWKEEARRL